MSIANYETIKADAFAGVIYCHCLFSWKDNLKRLGFKWLPKLKLWYINEEMFTYEIYQETMKPRFTNNTSTGVQHYYYVHYCTSQDIKSRLTSKEQYFKKQNNENKEIIKKYSEEMAELGKREEIKSKKYIKVKAKKKQTPPPENAEEFGAGYYIVDN